MFRASSLLSFGSFSASRRVRPSGRLPRGWGVAAAALGLLAFTRAAGAGTAAPGNYTLTDLGAVTATAINDQGQMVGFSGGPSSPQAFVYSGGAWQPLVGAPANFIPTGINAGGQIAGYTSADTTSGVEAYIYSGGALQDLGPLNGGTTNGINASGQVAATVRTVVGGGTFQAAVYSAGAFHLLGTLGRGRNSGALAINDAGTVVGGSDVSLAPVGAAFVAYPGSGQLQDLGTLGGAVSDALAINNRGEIVGTADPARANRGEGHAFLYANGAMQDLGTLGAGTVSGAQGINDAGQIVGGSFTNGSNGPAHAFLYEGGTMYDLNNLVSDTSGDVLYRAIAINASGQIVAEATTPSGDRHSVLLSPTAVPLPAAAWTGLAAIGLLSGALSCRRGRFVRAATACA